MNELGECGEMGGEFELKKRRAMGGHFLTRRGRKLVRGNGRSSSAKATNGEGGTMADGGYGHVKGHLPLSFFAASLKHNE